MDINQCYAFLNIPASASNDAVSRAFKQLALKYHPDKNRDRVEWANEKMTNLNIAYSSIMSYRFEMEKTDVDEGELQPEPAGNKKAESPQRRRKNQGPMNYYEGLDVDDYLIRRFGKFRETAKESLYKFFQYSLNNFVRRETPVNRGIFNRIVLSLRQTYHSMKKLAEQTENPELLEHFNVFSRMIFDFYRSAECLNINDSYRNPMDVDAFRLYRYGDESLHKAHKEVFYDRHNRGSFRMNLAQSALIDAIGIFRTVMKGYPRSSWVVETDIKLQYALSLKRYLDLFFNE